MSAGAPPRHGTHEEIRNAPCCLWHNQGPAHVHSYLTAGPRHSEACGCPKDSTTTARRPASPTRMREGGISGCGPIWKARSNVAHNFSTSGRDGRNKRGERMAESVPDLLWPRAVAGG